MHVVVDGVLARTFLGGKYGDFDNSSNIKIFLFYFLISLFHHLYKIQKLLKWKKN